MRERRRIPGLIARRTRVDTSLFVLLGVVVLLAAFAVTAAPRGHELLLRAELRAAVEATPPRQQALVGSETLDPDAAASANAGTVAALAASADAFRAELPSPLPGVLGPAGASVTLPAAIVSRGDGGSPGFDRALEVGVPDGWATQATVVEGVTPAPWSGTGPLPAALSRTAAADLRVGVGDVLTGAAVPVEITGLFDPADPGAPLWSQTNGTLGAQEIAVQGSTPRRIAAALIAPASLPLLGAALTGARVQVWFPLDADALGSADAATAALMLRHVGAGPQSLPGGQPLLFGVAAAPEIEAALARVDAAGTLLALIAAGPIALALAVVVLSAVVLAGRRDGAVRLARERGASGTQLRVALSAETGAVLLPAVVAGSGVAVVLTPGAGSATGWPWALALALAAASLAGLALPALRRPPAAARPVAEALVTGGAVVSVVLLAQRGLDGSARGADLLVASAPVLLAAAVAVLAHRTLPLLFHALHRAAAGTTGPVAVIGTARGQAFGFTATFALVAGVSVAGFAGGMLSRPDDAVGPLARGIPVAIVGAGALALVCGLAAGTLAVVSAAANRRDADRTLAILGFTPRQLRAVAIWETAPAAALVLGAGTMLAAAEIAVGRSLIDAGPPHPVDVLLPAVGAAVVLAAGLGITIALSARPRAAREETP